MLRALGVVATVFAPTDHIGTGQPTGWEGFEHAAQGPHASELICMDWDQLRTVAAAGWEHLLGLELVGVDQDRPQ